MGALPLVQGGMKAPAALALLTFAALVLTFAYPAYVGPIALAVCAAWVGAALLPNGKRR